jgi:glycosyltransferase involved in cell wall biosynthesis
VLAASWPPDSTLPANVSYSNAPPTAGARVFGGRATRAPGVHVAGETLRLAHLIEATRPHVVHLHSAKAGLAGRLAIRGRRPTVFQPHAWSFLAVEGPARLAAAEWERFAVRWTDALVCVSDAERQIGTAHGVRAATWVIPNGVDCASWTAAGSQDRASARARLGLSDRPLAVCVGRLCAQKGQHDLLDAWDAVRTAVQGAALALVGGGPDRASLQARVVGLRDVLLVGERADVRLWFAAADVVVVPSRWEGMALVPLEAMASARSVVATDVPGVAESVPANAGAVVAIGDRGGLADQIAVRLADRARADAEGAVGRRHVQARHDMAASAGAVVSLYSTLLRRQTRNRRRDREAGEIVDARPPRRFGL